VAGNGFLRRHIAGIAVNFHKKPMLFSNVYQDPDRAASYAALEFPGTYHLAYRDLPKLIAAHVTGKAALDFGCGTGRSTRFLKNLGFSVTGVDIAEDMLALARQKDPEGDYRRTGEDDLSALTDNKYDLILSVFTFDNIPTAEKKVRLFRSMHNLLKPNGRIISLVSSPEIYTHEWASFSTKDYPENKRAQSGDLVRIIMTDVADRRPVEDILFTDESYREVYAKSGLEIVEVHRPLGLPDEPYQWVNETSIAPWTIYVLKAAL